jgi:hypothetical protein
MRYPERYSNYCAVFNQNAATNNQVDRNLSVSDKPAFSACLPFYTQLLTLRLRCNRQAWRAARKLDQHQKDFALQSLESGRL